MSTQPKARTRTANRLFCPAVLGGAMAFGVAGLLGCSGASDGDGDVVGPSPTGTGGTSGAGSASGVGGDSPGAGGSGGGLVIGSGGAAGGGSTTGSGCQKVDFLFVVDNSASMQDNQAQLVAAFPGFISAIQTTVNAGNDIHILVTDTDAWGRCNTANPWNGMDPSSNLCDSYVKTTSFEECDRTWGAGVVHPAGKYASDKLCSFPAGRRWLQGSDTDISGTFACAAQVGVAGHPKERPMDSMVAALAPAINTPGGCNDGFLRDDALLVVTFISDDPNYEDSGTPKEWYDAVVAAKLGDPKGVVVVGFTPVGCSGGGGTKGAHWSEFVSMFPNHLEAQVCSGDYVSTFTQAVQLIDSSCDTYIPPVQ